MVLLMESPSEANVTAKPASRRWRLYGLGAVLVLVAGLAVLYATTGFLGNGVTVCAGAPATGKSLETLAKGEVAAFRAPLRPASMAKLTFSGPDGQPVKLADFAGKTVLLNLWATWCIPCRAEMPALAKLQAAKGGGDFQVVAVSLDLTGPERPKAFLKEVGADNLTFYADSTNAVLRDRDLAGSGLPQTYLLDPKGCQIGVVTGPAEWASADAAALIDAAVKTR
jgi:thiol-disulfide isomerase/thioredoxin